MIEEMMIASLLAMSSLFPPLLGPKKVSEFDRTVETARHAHRIARVRDLIEFWNKHSIPRCQGAFKPFRRSGASHFLTGLAIRIRRSPSPRPSPSGRGRMVDRLSTVSGVSGSRETGKWCSLSLRERAGVEKSVRHIKVYKK